jgi:hypothetical protein
LLQAGYSSDRLAEVAYLQALAWQEEVEVLTRLKAEEGAVLARLKVEEGAGAEAGEEAPFRELWVLQEKAWLFEAKGAQEGEAGLLVLPLTAGWRVRLAHPPWS